MGLLEDIMIAAVRGEPAPELPNWVEWEHVSMGKSHCDMINLIRIYLILTMIIGREVIMKINYLDCVEITVEREQYAKNGVHKGMQGVIWLDECIDGEWDVCFPQYGEKPDIAEIPVKEEDLMVIPKMDARENERIRALFEGN